MDFSGRQNIEYSYQYSTYYNVITVPNNNNNDGQGISIKMTVKFVKEIKNTNVMAKTYSI